MFKLYSRTLGAETDPSLTTEAATPATRTRTPISQSFVLAASGVLCRRLRRQSQSAQGVLAEFRFGTCKRWMAEVPDKTLAMATLWEQGAADRQARQRLRHSSLLKTSLPRIPKNPRWMIVQAG